MVALAVLGSGQSAAMAWVAGLTVWVACWWIFEPIEIPLTSMLPLAVLPLVGVLTPAQVGQAYGDPIILLLMGGFMLSLAVEKSGVHRRMALGMLALTGGRGGRPLVFGFLITAALLSMWISNTATSLMLLPIALAILRDSTDQRLVVAVLLAIAYGASIGGLGTPIGTPPNLIFMRVYSDSTGDVMSFTGYMRYGVPVVLAMLPVVGLWLARGLPSGAALQLPSPGAWRPAERRVLTVFALTAIAWITRGEPYGGWSVWFDLPQANDAQVALLACVLLALLPDGDRERPGRLLDWQHAQRTPWGILLLFGSGVALANGFASSGLSTWIGTAVGDSLVLLPPLLLIATVCLVVTHLTEVTSNTATATLLMPILAAAALGAGIDPKLLMIPAAMSASCAFMLPVATGPNAVVFGSSRISIAEMARAGFAINLLGSVVITMVCWVLLT
jgi:sodium-dependent dicarboxylate transporter 2/3/5